MAGFYNLDQKEVIRVKVKYGEEEEKWAGHISSLCCKAPKCDGKMQPEYKKFSIDPQITSFEMLQGILARAFDIHSDFTISYLAMDSEGQSVYLSMLSDWDMDAAFQCAADPCLKLKVDLRPFEEELEDWDVIAPVDIPQHRISSLLDKNSILGSITGTITHNLGKTVNSMQRAIGLKQPENEIIKPLKPPMSDMEFRNYLDSAGFMLKPNEFRLSIYQGGIEPSLRRVAWRHLLNIYPANMSGKDRFDYMKRKEEEYRKLREEWLERFKNNSATEEVKYVASMVKKDVLRTDRSQGFYAGNDENENTLSLFHILVTYALTHPDVSYCQGMSDLASPLLVTQKDEGQAYICFCALMNRLRENFTVEGSAIMTKFRHLSDVLSMYDPALHAYLLQNSAGDMFFCYRWFLLELKREFPFTDALYVLEVMWATLPPNPPKTELALVDPDYSSRLLSSSPCSPTFSFQHAMYAKLLAMRRVGALQRVAQSAMRIANPTPRASANNNLSTEPSPYSACRNTSAVSSFDTSPGDGEDRGGDFPEVDIPLTRSMQRKSDSIDQVLQEGAAANDNDEDGDGRNDIYVPGNIENSSEEAAAQDVICVAENHFGDGHGQNFTSRQINISYPGSSTLVDNQLSPSNHNGVELSDELRGFPVEESVGFNFTSPNVEDEIGTAWPVSSGVSESSDQSDHVQFSLSLDSNTNNSVEVEETPVELRAFVCSDNDSEQQAGTNNVLYIKAESQNSKDNDAGSTDTNHGLFRSMKRLLASPKRRTFNNSSQGSAASPTASPRKSATSGPRHVPSAPVLTPTTEQAQVINKTNSESHISDCQEATETLESSGSSTSSASKPIARDPSKLPPPQEFGAGNPFLMFVCLTLLIQHRDTVISQGMCYEEIAMHFDRLVRRHNANRVLHHARQMYTEYLRAQQVKMEKQEETEGFKLSC